MANSAKEISNTLTRMALCCALAMCANVVLADSTVSCYVTGNTSSNNLGKSLGSAQNPYGSLSEVEADFACEKIVVYWSESVLDGGIALRPGQLLVGRRGPNGQRPVITNSSDAQNGGRGVWVSADNIIRHMHIMDTWRQGVGGPLSGSLKIEKSRVTGSGQVGTPAGLSVLGDGAWPNVVLAMFSDADITIKNSEFGQSAGSGLALFQIFGHGSIRINKITVSDQSALTDDTFEESPGITVWTLNDASADVQVKNVTVENIGRGNSNSDGIVLLNLGSGEFIAEVDRYTYRNPDGDGGGSATGIELGLAHAGDATFQATVSSSDIEGSTSCGIQVLDFATNLGGNRLDVALQGNRLIDNLVGICGWQEFTADSEYNLIIEDNLVRDSTAIGAWLVLGGDNSSYTVLAEDNVIADSGQIGLLAERYLHNVGSHVVDAGFGALGSKGGNRITGSADYDVYSYGMDVSAANNWWGRPSGPSSILVENGAVVDVDPLLAEDPSK